MRLALAAICTMVATSAHADVGIGVSAKTDSATIYIPVTAGRFMYEPYVRATDREAASVSTSGTIFPITTTTESEVHANVIGVGVFRLVPLADRFTMYYGARLERIDEEATSSGSSSLSISVVSQPAQFSSAEGHSIVPTLGFHYNIIERLSIGAEIGLNHSDVETNTIVRSQSGAITTTSTSDITTNDTRADVILRFFF
jgi:hypothetical protein